MILAREADFIIWVDTHLDTHTAAICDGRGRSVTQLQVPATAAGYARMLAWARSAAGDSRAVWAVEGTRHYGVGLARYLAEAGEQVSEIDASRHVGKRRAGKSDAIDAVRAARELLARPHPAQMRADGDREALRLLMIDRDNAVQSAKTARTALAAILVTAPAPLRERLRGLPRERRANECAALTLRSAFLFGKMEFYAMLKLPAIRLLLVGALAASALIGPPSAALAATPPPPNPSCNSNIGSSWTGFDWIPGGSNHLYGVRAPVKRRVDGLLCTDSGHDSTSSVWIAIQAVSGGSNIVQIGFIHKYDSQGVGEWCRFWEIPGINPRAYGCGTDNDDEQVYFKIEQFCSGQGCTYVIYDCGTGGDFTNCNPQDSSTPLFGSPAVGVASEAHFYCNVRMMGQGSDRVWYGNATWGTSIEDNNGWSINRNWSDYGGNHCTSDYKSANGGPGLLRTWDSRNTS